jgi:hypothetical protein
VSLRLVVDNTRTERVENMSDEDIQNALFAFYNQRTDGRNKGISQNDRQSIKRWFGDVNEYVSATTL